MREIGGGIWKGKNVVIYIDDNTGEIKMIWRV